MTLITDVFVSSLSLNNLSKASSACIDLPKERVSSHAALQSSRLDIVSLTLSFNSLSKALDNTLICSPLLIESSKVPINRRIYSSPVISNKFNSSDANFFTSTAQEIISLSHLSFFSNILLLLLSNIDNRAAIASKNVAIALNVIAQSSMKVYSQIAKWLGVSALLDNCIHIAKAKKIVMRRTRSLSHHIDLKCPQIILVHLEISLQNVIGIFINECHNLCMQSL